MRIAVEYSRSIDLQRWAASASMREVPDVWPYGLHRLGERFDVVARGGERLPAWQTRAPGGYEWARTPPPGLSSADLILCWEERVAFPLALKQRGSAAAVAGGVIWETDILARHAGGLRRRAVAAALRRMSLVWSLSAAQVEILDALTRGRTHVEYLQFGIDAEFFGVLPYSPTISVVSAGNDRHRDWTTLFAALAQARARLAWPLTAWLQTSNASAPPGIVVSGRVPHIDLRAMYGRAAVVAVATHPNLHCSGMTVALEAAAVGRPVVVTATQGMDDYVVHGETGLLVPPGDVGALRDAILELVMDPDRAAAMGAAARARVEACHTTAHMVDKLVAMLEKS